MPDTNTLNYNWVKPEVGGSGDTWGDKMNDNLDDQDTLIKTLADAIALKLAAASYTAADVLAKLLTVDGSGSGIDADKVDGVEAAAFLLAATYTAGDVLAKILTVDGAGSGLDADTLDGLQAAAFALAGHVHNYLPLAGGEVSGPILRQGAGAYLHLAANLDNGGRVYITDTGAADPTSQPGDIWIAYEP